MENGKAKAKRPKMARYTFKDFENEPAKPDTPPADPQKT